MGDVFSDASAGSGSELWGALVSVSVSICLFFASLLVLGFGDRRLWRWEFGEERGEDLEAERGEEKEE